MKKFSFNIFLIYKKTLIVYCNNLNEIYCLIVLLKQFYNTILLFLQQTNATRFLLGISINSDDGSFAFNNCFRVIFQCIFAHSTAKFSRYSIHCAR